MSGIIGVSPNMRSGVLGKYPTGHVLNSSFYRTTESTVTKTADSWSSTVASSTYTFKHVNSSLIVLGHINWAKTNGATYWGFLRIRRGSVTKAEIHSYGGDTTDYYGIHSTCNFIDSGTHAVNDVWTYDIQLMNDNNSSNVVHNVSTTAGYKSSFTFFEIAT